VEASLLFQIILSGSYLMQNTSFFLEGQGRVTLFAGQSNARTFNYQPGDIGYVPAGFGKDHILSNNPR
jgi:oxalate decarboxylase/phosphoglucose isomerase-like protein (cupin superfamily)